MVCGILQHIPISRFHVRVMAFRKHLPFVGIQLERHVGAHCIGGAYRRTARHRWELEWRWENYCGVRFGINSMRDAKFRYEMCMCQKCAIFVLQREADKSDNHNAEHKVFMTLHSYSESENESHVHIRRARTRVRAHVVGWVGWHFLFEANVIVAYIECFYYYQGCLSQVYWRVSTACAVWYVNLWIVAKVLTTHQPPETCERLFLQKITLLL